MGNADDGLGGIVKAAVRGVVLEGTGHLDELLGLRVTVLGFLVTLLGRYLS